MDRTTDPKVLTTTTTLSYILTASYTFTIQLSTQIL